MRRSAVLATALALDLALGEPPAGLHPVVWFGRLVSALERRAPRGAPALELAAGTAMVALSLGVAVATSVAAGRALARISGTGGDGGEARVDHGRRGLVLFQATSSRLSYDSRCGVCPLAHGDPDGARTTHSAAPISKRSLDSALAVGGRHLVAIAIEAWLLKTTLAVRALTEAARRVQGALQHGDLDAGREAVRSLVSRETGSLSAPLVAAATIESVAENASDAIVAPALAYLAVGLPGTVLYRGINTLEAMVGYRGQFEWIGKAAARLDDAANLLPARLTAGLLVVAAAVARRSGSAAWRVLVTNEVGFGLVPPTPLGRAFRDILGRLNQTVATRADGVFLVVAGLGVELKRLAVAPETWGG